MRCCLFVCRIYRKRRERYIYKSYSSHIDKDIIYPGILSKISANRKILIEKEEKQSADSLSRWFFPFSGHISSDRLLVFGAAAASSKRGGGGVEHARSKRFRRSKKEVYVLKQAAQHRARRMNTRKIKKSRLLVVPWPLGIAWGLVFAAPATINFNLKNSGAAGKEVVEGEVWGERWKMASRLIVLIRGSIHK